MYFVAALSVRRECQLTKKFSNNGYRISFSHKRNKHVQRVNLHKQKVYWERGQRMVKLRISAKVDDSWNAFVLKPVCPNLAEPAS